MSHADETVTDPHVYRLRAALTGRGAVFAWDYPGAALLRVRITRTPAAPGTTHAPPGVSPEVVYDGRGGSFRDAGDAGVAPSYRVEATLDGETWVTWHDGPV
jgi:hypothetical protein